MPTGNAPVGWPRGESHDARQYHYTSYHLDHAPLLRRRIPLDGLNPAVYAAWRRGSVSTRVGRRSDGGGPILISDAASMTTTMNPPFGAAWRIAVRRAAPLLCAALLWLPQNAAAQDRGSVNPEPLPPLAHPEDPATPAKELFGRKTAPARHCRSTAPHGR